MSEESPRKRSRRESRISKITSTPINNDGSRLTTPSISTIYKTSSSVLATDYNEGLVELIDDNDGTTSSVLSTSTTSDEADWKFDDYLKKFQWIGVWSDLRPHDRSSLLYRISQAPNEIPMIISELIMDNRENIEFILISLFKLLANASGISGDDINIEALRRDGGIRELVRTIERRLYSASKKHIMMKNTKAGRNIYVIFSQFFIKFFEPAYNSKLLFSEHFEGYFFEFITCMTKSQLRPIRMPAVIAANSLLTGCLKLYKNRLNTNRQLRNKAKLDKTVDFFYYIFNTNCLIPDKEFYTVRLFTIQHIIQWIELFPQVFINDRRCLKILCQLTQDDNSSVRLAAIHGFKQLIENDALNANINPFMERIFNYICNRCNDIDRKITNKSLNIAISMLPQCNSFINLDIKLQIVKIIFQDNAGSAKLAGKFMVKYLRAVHRRVDEFIVALVKILSMRKEFTDLMPLLADACIDNCPELTDWVLLIEIILNEHNPKLKKEIVELMYETILFKLTGKFSFNRNETKQDVSEIEDNHQSIGKVILPRCEILFNVLRDQEDVLIRLSDFLLILDHEKCKIPELISVYVNIIKLYIDVLNEVTDRKLLEKVCKILAKFYTFDDIVEEAIDIIMRDLIATYKTEKQRLTEISRTSIYSNISKLSYKISILFGCFDLRKFIKWQDIFCFTNDEHLLELKHLITCCKWYLIWSIRCYRDNEDSINYIELKKQLQDFIDICLNIINVIRTKSWHYHTFGDLCELYTEIAVILLEDEQKYHQFLLPITDEDQQKQVLIFMEQKIITNKALSLSCRCQYLLNFTGVLYQEIIPITGYAFIFKHYATHFDDYHRQIESMMVQLYRKPPSLAMVILDTLAVLYKEILQKQRMVDVNSDQAKPLTALSKKFHLFIKERKFEGICSKLLSGAINFVFMSRNHYEFLYFVRMFVDCLSADEKVTLRNIFVQKLPQEDRRHDIILVFGSCLKKNK